MSSNVQHVDFRSSESRMLREMLKKAGYITARIKPLEGPLQHPSQALLRRFLAGTIQASAR